MCFKKPRCDKITGIYFVPTAVGNNSVCGLCTWNSTRIYNVPGCRIYRRIFKIYGKGYRHLQICMADACLCGGSGSYHGAVYHSSGVEKIKGCHIRAQQGTNIKEKASLGEMLYRRYTFVSVSISALQLQQAEEYACDICS